MEKLTYCIWAALLMVVLACHENRQYDEQLQCADSLMEQSGSDIVAAAEGLNAIHADYHRMNHRQQMRYRLLQVKARNKLGQSVAGDTVMRDVADYYRRHGTPNERVEALYLLARVYHDQGLLPQAIETYQMADQAADTTRSDCNWKHLFLVHSQLSQIYSDQRLPDSNLRELDIMRLYASKAKDTLNVILCDAWKSGVLWDKGMYDQAVDAENLINQKLIRKGYQTYANIIFLSLTFSYEALADEGDVNFQVIIDSDGVEHYVPADTPIELIVWYIELYEKELEMIRAVRGDNRPKPL